MKKLVSPNKDFNLFRELLNSLYNSSKKQLQFDEDVKVHLVKNSENSLNPLGKTAAYNPQTREIELYFVGRHPKDLMRSFSHELVHHAQNCRGDLNNIPNTNEGYAQENEHLREMEREAYECGNMIFRDWEDKMKKKGAVPLFSGAPFATIQMGYNENLGDKKMSKKLNESKLRDIIRGVIQEMFDEDLNEETTMDQMMDDNAGESEAIALGAGDEDIAVGEGHDYDTKGTPLEDPEDPEDPERYMKGKVGGRVMEDSEGEETYHYGEDEGEDEKRLKRGDLSKSHAAALRKDMDYDEDHEDRDEPGTNFRESYLPQGRDIRTEARKRTYAKLLEKWCK
tara:strand:- start:5577 stop:6593 length:1017 start_codon:yes stop_codon:yes gene_type:complete